MNFLSNNTIYHSQRFYDVKESLKTNIDFGNIDEYYDFLESIDMSGILFKEIDLIYNDITINRSVDDFWDKFFA